MTEVYLVAIRHDDIIGGPGKLRRLYDSLSPGVILTETSQRFYDELTELSTYLGKKLLEAKVDASKMRSIVERFNLYAYGFPLILNIEYAKEKSLVNHFVSTYLPINAQSRFDLAGIVGGIVDIARRNNGLVPDGLVKELMQEEIPIPKEVIQKEWETYSRREKGILHEWQLLRLLRAGFLGESDELMEERIRKFHGEGSRIVFPVGTFHTTDSLLGITLYSRIKDLKPERILLA